MSKSISVRCGGCRVKLTLNKRDAGKIIACRKCGSKLQVPGKSASAGNASRPLPRRQPRGAVRAERRPVKPTIAPPEPAEPVILEPTHSFDDVPVEERTHEVAPEVEALLDVDLERVHRPVRQRKQKRNNVKATRKKTKRKTRKGDKKPLAPYEHHGLADDQRRTRFRFDGTAVGGLLAMFFGLCIISVGIATGFYSIWGPILFVGGAMGLIRGMFG